MTSSPTAAGPVAARFAPPSIGMTVALCLLLNAVPCMLGRILPSSDWETHLFFADHYRTSWFAPWEPRWYGGFFVYSYPPLVHQLTALLGHLVGLERAYGLIELAVVACVPLAIWRLTLEIVDPLAARCAALFAVLSACVSMNVYVYGQLPSLASFVLALAGTAFLLRYVRRPHHAVADLAASAGFCGASVATHMLTGLIALPMLLAAAVVHLAIVARTPSPSRPPLLAVSRRLLAALVCIAVAAALPLAPFAWWMQTSQVRQAAIFHATRYNFLRNPNETFMYFTGLWGGALLAFLPALYVGLRRPTLRVWTLLMGLWAVLSLGPAITPLPGLLFGPWTDWLTYERFGLWGALLVLLPFGTWLARRGTTVVVTLAAAFVITAVGAVAYGELELTQESHVSPAVLEQTARFLDQQAGWRYLTLGLDQQDMPRLSRLTRASSIDGAYFTARRDPRVSRSGVGLLDTVLSWQVRNLALLRIILSRPADDRLKWVVCANPRAFANLRDQRWICLGTITEQGLDPSRREVDEVTIWTAPGDVPGIDDAVPASPPALAVLWGIAPIALLAIGMLGVIASDRRPTDEVECHS